MHIRRRRIAVLQRVDARVALRVVEVDVAAGNWKGRIWNGGSVSPASPFDCAASLSRMNRITKGTTCDSVIALMNDRELDHGTAAQFCSRPNRASVVDLAQSRLEFVT